MLTQSRMHLRQDDSHSILKNMGPFYVAIADAMVLIRHSHTRLKMIIRTRNAGSRVGGSRARINHMLAAFIECNRSHNWSTELGAKNAHGVRIKKAHPHYVRAH